MLIKAPVVLTSALLKNSRCPSAIVSKATVVGAKTVIGPGASMTDARSVFCRERCTLVKLQQTPHANFVNWLEGF